MREIIAKVRLARGEVGYFDELTRMHLTLSNPYGTIYKGMNTTNIQMSVHYGRLDLVSGSFSPAAKPVEEKIEVIENTKEVEQKEPPKEEPKEAVKEKPKAAKKKEPAETKAKKEEVKAESKKTEPKKEEVAKKAEPKKARAKKEETKAIKDEDKKEEK